MLGSTIGVGRPKQIKSSPVPTHILARQVLADWGASLYRAGLVPAANVHLGLAAPHGGPLLRPEVAALLGPPPPGRGFARPQARDAAPTGQVRRSCAVSRVFWGNAGDCVGEQVPAQDRHSAMCESALANRCCETQAQRDVLA